jgi:GH24 family phage-related lysozyme (muramidase)
MNLSDRGAAFIESLEGVVLHPYNDSQGHCTIGIGHLIHRGNCTAADRQRYAGFTRQQADELFRQDIETIYGAAVNRLVKVPLTQDQFDALVSFVFNIGIGDRTRGFTSSTVLRKLNQGDYAGAADAFMMWNKPPEIVGRRRKEQALFRSNSPAVLPGVNPTTPTLPNSQGLHPEFLRRLVALYADTPFTITSGYRSSTEQQWLYNLFKSGRGSPANKPGTSNHEAVPFGPAEGLAADLRPAQGYSVLHVAAAKHKLYFPLAGEPWHAQPIECRSPHYTGRCLGPAIQPTQEDDDMVKIVGIAGHGLCLVDGLTYRHIDSPQEVDELVAAGVAIRVGEGGPDWPATAVKYLVELRP